MNDKAEQCLTKARTDRIQIQKQHVNQLLTSFNQAIGFFVARSEIL